MKPIIESKRRVSTSTSNRRSRSNSSEEVFDRLSKGIRATTNLTRTFYSLKAAISKTNLDSSR